MALETNERILVLTGNVTGSVGETWSEILQRWFVECPQCTNVWLVVGARESDAHVCKGCGHGFAIKTSVARSERTSTEVVAARKTA